MTEPKLQKSEEPKTVSVSPVQKPECWKASTDPLPVRPGDRLEFDSGGFRAQIWLPYPDIIGEKLIDLAPGDKKSFPVLDELPDGEYPYGFHLYDKNETLEGACSPPRIKIYR
jgi:hypothetical protein